MNKSRALAKDPPAGGVAPAPSQYLKISYSSRRFMLITALANDLGCSWQSIALAVIDEFLDREFPRKTPN